MTGCLGLEAFNHYIFCWKNHPPSTVGPPLNFGGRQLRSFWVSNLGNGERVGNGGSQRAWQRSLFRMTVLAVWNPWDMNPKWIFFLVEKSPKILRSSLPKKTKFQAEKEKSDLNFGLCVFAFWFQKSMFSTNKLVTDGSFQSTARLLTDCIWKFCRFFGQHQTNGPRINGVVILYIRSFMNMGDGQIHHFMTNF